MKTNHRRQGTLIKVTSLAVGLTVGLVLIPAMCRYIPEIEVGTRWTYQFTDEKLTTEDGTHHDFEHAVFAVFVLLVIAAVVLLQTYRVATSNPVNYLKTE